MKRRDCLATGAAVVSGSALGLPIGLSISGAPWAESTVIALAQACQQATEWHTWKPRLDRARRRSASRHALKGVPYSVCV